MAILTLEEQIKRIRQIGYTIDDEEKLKDFLKFHNYFTFEQYFFEEDNPKKTQLPIQRVKYRFYFDRRVRSYLRLPLEIIETNFKSVIIDCLANNYGEYAHINEEIYLDHDSFTYTRDIMIPRIKNSRWLEEDIHQKIQERKELEEEYTVTIFEYLNILSLGEVKKFYLSLDINIQNEISIAYCGEGAERFQEYLIPLIDLRNSCAHLHRLAGAKICAKQEEIIFNGVEEPNNLYTVLLIINKLATKTVPNKNFILDYFKNQINNFRFAGNEPDSEQTLNYLKKYYGFTDNWEIDLLN